MDKIKILTSQHVTIGYELASIGDRILATLIDWLILLGGALILTGLGSIFTYFNSNGSVVIMFIIFLPMMFYNLLSEVFLNGQTIGKRSRKIKVIRIDGTEPRFGNYLMRWVFRLIEVLPYGIIATITILINGKGQRLGDIAAGTTVIKIRAAKMINPVFTPENYEPVFMEAANLKEHEFNLILSSLEDGKPIHLQNMLAEKLKINLNIQTSLDDGTFLRTLVMDFNALSRSESI